jgi:hypothetical protein
MRHPGTSKGNKAADSYLMAREEFQGYPEAFFSLGSTLLALDCYNESLLFSEGFPCCIQYPRCAIEGGITFRAIMKRQEVIRSLRDAR